MAIAQIKITYKQLIDARAETDFERDIFDTSYNEFLTKSRIFNAEGKFRTFTQIQENDSRANTLHCKLSNSIMHLLDELKSFIPNLKDNLGQKIAFETSEVKLIESDLQDWSVHCLAIYYTTANLVLHNFVGEYLLLSMPEKNTDSRKEEADTFMLKMQPNLAISTYQEYKNRVASDFTGFAAN